MNRLSSTHHVNKISVNFMTQESSVKDNRPPLQTQGLEI
jgi:hypothetical protein